MPLVKYATDDEVLGAKAPSIDYRDVGNEIGYDPSAWNAVRAIGPAFRQNNMVGSAVANKLAGLDTVAPESDFTSEVAYKEIVGTKYEPYWERLAPMMNRRAFNAMRDQIDMEDADKADIAAAGWAGTLLSAGAQIADIPSLLPGGALVKGATAGATILRTAVSTGVAAATAGAVSEIGLQETQQTRPLAESAVNIGAGALFGTFLGAGAGALLSKAERGAALQAFDRARTFADDSDRNLSEFRSGVAESMGAAAAPAAKLEDFDIAGKGARAVGKATAKLNPTLRAAHSPSAEHRSIMADMQETGFYLERDLKGEGSSAVESAMKYWERGALGDAVTSNVDLYVVGRKAGMTMSLTEFNEAVGKAMRRNDVGENEWVSKAAAQWRTKLFDPLKKGAIETGIFADDVAVTTAPSYLSRLYKSKLIEAEEGAFKGITKQWLRGQLETIEETVARAAMKGKKTEADLPEFVSPADKEAYIQQIADDVFNKLTGRTGIGEPSYAITVAKRGPMKERTFSIPDHLIERYLESDIELVGRRYARVMSADVELARKFGRADMRDQITKVRESYAKLREEAAAAGASEKKLLALSAREKRDVNDLEGIRDILRGQYKTQLQHTNFARVLNAAGTFNYIRSMGAVLINNLNDAARPIMVNGLKRYMGEGIAPLMTNLKAVKISVREAKILGAVTEKALLSRLSSMAELADPYAMASPFERFLDNTATIFSKMTLMPWFNDMNKGIASVLIQNRILSNAIGDFDKLAASERAYMGFVGLNRETIDRIATMFNQFGEVDGNVHIANVEHWTDDVAVRAYAAALNKDVDSTIVTKGAGDIPLFANTPAGRALIQFRSYALASNQRVLMRGLQEGPGSVMTGIVAMTAMGMFSYWIGAKIAGREVSSDPGTWVAEGLDRSGIFSLPFEVNNTYEKLGGSGVYSAAAKITGGTPRKATRYATRGVVDAYAGPTFGLAKDLASLISAGMPVTRGERPDFTPSDTDTARRLTPFASLPYFRWLVDGTIVPEIKERAAQ